MQSRGEKKREEFSGWYKFINVPTLPQLQKEFSNESILIHSELGDRSKQSMEFPTVQSRVSTLCSIDFLSVGSIFN